MAAKLIIKSHKYEEICAKKITFFKINLVYSKIIRKFASKMRVLFHRDLLLTIKPY
jgi:hypothetical protein